MSLPESIKRQVLEGLVHNRPVKTLAWKLDIPFSAVQVGKIFIQYGKLETLCYTG